MHITELFSIETCNQAVIDFLAATDIMMCSSILEVECGQEE